MALTHDFRPIPELRQEGAGPQILFAAALFAAAAAWIYATRTFTADHAMPFAATLLILLAAAAAVIGWYRGSVAPDRVSYWDAAGALTLIGACAAATVDPEQLLRIVETGGTSQPDNRNR